MAVCELEDIVDADVEGRNEGAIYNYHRSAKERLTRIDDCFAVTPCVCQLTADQELLLDCPVWFWEQHHLSA